MHHINAATRFVLRAPIDSVPKGATGQLTRLSGDYVAANFDDARYPEMVFDVHDTEPEVRESIKCLRNPMPLRLKVAVLTWAAFVTGWVLDPPSVPSAHVAYDFVMDKLVPL